jgi:hypothetical protein
VSGDMSPVIVPKSDQINAEDFLAGPNTYVIESVAISPGTEQPVSIRLVGEKRVWRPCKSMCRVMVAAWGADAKVYPGRSVTLYRDPAVKWAGMEIGGIRISHLSHIAGDMMLQLTATKGKRAPHVIRPLATAVPKLTQDEAADINERLVATGSNVESFLRHFRVECVEDMTAPQYVEAMALLKRKAEPKPEEAA